MCGIAFLPFMGALDKTPEHQIHSIGQGGSSGSAQKQASQVHLSYTSYPYYVCGLLSNAWYPSLLIISRFNIWQWNHIYFFSTLQFTQCRHAIFWFSQQICGVANRACAASTRPTWWGTGGSGSYTMLNGSYHLIKGFWSLILINKIERPCHKKLKSLQQKE